MGKTGKETAVGSRSRPTEIRRSAESMAMYHKKCDPNLREIYFLPHGAEIRLIEISNAVPDTGEALPFRFNPDPKAGVRYPSTVILLHPDEWKRVKKGSMALPRGWRHMKAVRLYPAGARKVSGN